MKKLFLSIALLFVCAFGLVACGNKVSEELEAAAKYLDGMYLSGEVVDGAFVAKAEETPDDYSVVSKVIGLGKAFDIEWSIEMISGNPDDVVLTKGEKETLIIINEKSEEVAKYYLVAVIKDDKTSIEKKYEKVKPAYQLMTWEEVQAADDDSVINGSGVITGIVGTSKLNIYFENEQGGYYIYGYTPTEEVKPLLAVGKTIEVSGVKDTHSGLVEFTNATVNVLADDTKTLTPKDVTETFKAAATTKDESLAKLVNQYVTIKGVTMKDITNDGKYLNFTLAGKETYVYISSSSNMVTSKEIETLKGKVQEGMEANITGMVALFNGAFNIIPNTVDSIELVIPELSDAEKVADAKEKALKLAEEKVVADLDLFTTTVYEGVSVSWTSSNTELIANDGKLVASPAADTEVTLTAVITAGSASETVEVKVVVAAVAKMSIAEVNKLYGEENIVCVEAKVVATYNSGKGCFIADSTGVAYLYTKLPEGIALGDSVKLIAKTTVWENSGKEYTRQLQTISIEKLDKEVNVVKPSKVELSEIVDKFGDATTMTEEQKAEVIASPYYGRLYEFTGYVVEHKFGNYTNYGLSLTADGATFVLYQYQNDLQDEFKALLGKKVTIVAPMYGFSAQYGWRIGTYLTAVEAGEEATSTLPTAKNSVADAKILEKGTAVELIGQVATVYTGQGFVLTDGTGGIYVYVKGDVTVVAGDIVKVTGKTDFYKAPQIGNTDLVVEKLAEGTFTADPVEMTVEEYLAMDPKDYTNFGKVVKVVGTPVVSGKYVNCKLTDDKTANLYLNDDVKAALTELAGQKVEFIAITYNQSGSYPFTMLVISYKVVTE